jgi:hypothetical protein
MLEILVFRNNTLVSCIRAIVKHSLQVNSTHTPIGCNLIIGHNFIGQKSQHFRNFCDAVLSETILLTSVKAGCALTRKLNFLFD